MPQLNSRKSIGALLALRPEGLTVVSIVCRLTCFCKWTDVCVGAAWALRRNQESEIRQPPRRPRRQVPAFVPPRVRFAI